MRVWCSVHSVGSGYGPVVGHFEETATGRRLIYKIYHKEIMYEGVA